MCGNVYSISSYESRIAYLYDGSQSHSMFRASRSATLLAGKGPDSFPSTFTGNVMVIIAIPTSLEQQSFENTKQKM